MGIRFNVFYISMLIYAPVHSSGTSSDKEGEKPRRRFYKKWSTEEEEKLLFFDVLTDDGQPNSFTRLKSYWHDAYPNSNVTDIALRRKIYKLREESCEKGERKKKFKWSHERKTELLDIYYTTRPYNPGAKRTLDEEWNRRYQDYQLAGYILLKYVRQILRQRRGNQKLLEEGTSDTGIEWNNQRDSDLLHAHYIANLEGKSRSKNTCQMWSDLHPQYSHVTLDQLKERTNYLKNNPPNEYFPWTKEEDEELLDIFDKTMPDVEDQGQRIYDIWSKIHPRYKFMTPIYLQVHASTLAHEREMQGASKAMRRGWTHGEKADLVNLYRRHLRERPGYHGFHKEWVRKKPRLAYMTNVRLKDYARRFEEKGFCADSEKLREGSSNKGKKKYTLGGDQKLHEEYGESSTKESEHSERSMKGYLEEREAHTPMKSGSLKKLMGRLEKQKSEKPHGKAPVVYSSDEQESPPSNMSEGYD